MKDFLDTNAFHPEKQNNLLLKNTPNLVLDEEDCRSENLMAFKAKEFLISLKIWKLLNLTSFPKNSINQLIK